MFELLVKLICTLATRTTSQSFATSIATYHIARLGKWTLICYLSSVFDSITIKRKHKILLDWSIDAYEGETVFLLNHTYQRG
jgi:hypothetical protein